MADEGALAIEGPEVAEPVGIWGSEWDAETEGGVVGMEGRLEDLWICESNKVESSKYWKRE